MTGEKRILLIRVGKLGDTIWGTSPIAALTAYYGPDARIDVVVQKGLGGLFMHDPRVSRVFEMAHRRQPLFVNSTKLGILWRSLRQPYDLALDMETGPFFRFLFLLLRARKKVSASSIPRDTNAPIEHAMASVRKVAKLALPPELATTVAPNLHAPQASFRQALVPGGTRYVCLHLGNSWVAAGRRDQRAWPEAHWRQLLQSWAEYFPDHTPVIIGTASERALAAKITEGLEGCTDICGKTDIPQMMAVIAGADAFIGTDTGPSHMAAALGVPVVSVFGPTNPRQTGPFSHDGNVVKILSAGLSCSPCVHTPEYDRCQHNRCMDAITPTMVATTALALLRADASASGLSRASPSDRGKPEEATSDRGQGREYPIPLA